ncbi:hypothetical protein Riv7116_0791 [Rivularia sp. PCC 7116]|nr:hypothetical protein Riv7116_0791 [Rivularia sp. PCC 7116]
MKEFFKEKEKISGSITMPAQNSDRLRAYRPQNANTLVQTITR